MERQEIRKYQMAQMYLLKSFDKICKDNGWTYYLVFGSLLGAIRHKGYIPWDADTDVAMYRDDYEAIRKWFKNNPNTDIFYDHYDTDKNHIFPHAILRIKNTHVRYNVERSSRYQLKNDGIYLDIFPIDYVVNDKKKQKKQVRLIWIIKKIIELKAAPTYGTRTSKVKRVCKKVISFLLTPISFRGLNKYIDKVMQRFNDYDTDKVAILTDPQDFDRCLFPKNVFGQPTQVDFEGEKILGPSNPDLFLKIQYGDYMTPPDEGERWDYLDRVIKEVDYGPLNISSN